MNKNEHREWTESDERAARELLAKLEARTGKAAGCLQESPEKFIRPMAGTRGLGQSEEKNRRQFPHANDNGRKGESPERDFGEPLDRLSQFPCLGGFEWHGFKGDRQGLDRVLSGDRTLALPQPLPSADERGAPTDHAAQTTFSAFLRLTGCVAQVSDRACPFEVDRVEQATHPHSAVTPKPVTGVVDLK